jgi:hypothetical protein
MSQRLREKRLRKTKSGVQSVLSGLVSCFDCGASLNISKTKDYYYFVCATNRVSSGRFRELANKPKCSRHSIQMIHLEEIVLAKIQETVSFALSDREQFAKTLHRMANKESEKFLKANTAKLAKAEARIAALDKIIARTYEEHGEGKNNNGRFEKMLTGFESEQTELITAAEILKNEICDLKTKVLNLDKFMKLVEQYGEITVLTPEVARAFIERIVVHESIYKNGKHHGKARQDIDIYFTHIGKIDE